MPAPTTTASYSAMAWVDGAAVDMDGLLAGIAVNVAVGDSGGPRQLEGKYSPGSGASGLPRRAFAHRLRHGRRAHQFRPGSAQVAHHRPQGEHGGAIKQPDPELAEQGVRDGR